MRASQGARSRVRHWRPCEPGRRDRRQRAERGRALWAAAFDVSTRAPCRGAIAVLLLALAAAPLASQGIGAIGASHYRVEIGAAASTPIVEDGNGVAVR